MKSIAHIAHPALTLIRSFGIIALGVLVALMRSSRALIDFHTIISVQPPEAGQTFACVATFMVDAFCV